MELNRDFPDEAEGHTVGGSGGGEVGNEGIHPLGKMNTPTVFQSHAHLPRQWVQWEEQEDNPFKRDKHIGCGANHVGKHGVEISHEAYPHHWRSIEGYIKHQGQL